MTPAKHGFADWFGGETYSGTYSFTVQPIYAELRERVEAADREQANARALAAEANASLQQLERAHAR
jgi:hypothetical protein